MQLTALELSVLKCAWHGSYGGGTNAKEIARNINQPVASVKGALGSLVKKNLIFCYTDKRDGKVFHDVFPIYMEVEIMFDGESMDADEWAEMNAHRQSVIEQTI